MKVDKDFVLSDSSVNCYGFRLLTSGYQLNEFAKNPIGYRMHDRDAGVAVRWDNLRIDGDKILGRPVINLSNSQGQQNLDEVINGFMNAASMGHFVVIEASEDEALKLPGQTGPTITKWYNRECSLVDVPGNFNALVLYDKSGNEINLSTFCSSSSMNITQNALPIQIPLLSSVDNDSCNNMDVSKQLAIAYKNNDITAEMKQQLSDEFANKPKELSRVLRALADERLRYLMSLSWAELDKSGNEELFNRYLQGYKFKRNQAFGGVKKIAKDGIEDGFFSQGDVNGWEWNFSKDPDKLIQVMFSCIQKKIDVLMSESWDKLSSDSKIDFLKTNYLQGFKQKYSSKFGIEYTDKK